MRRLFFALWPQRARQDALAEAAHEIIRACGGRAIPAQNLHVTLAFLGSVPEENVGRVQDVAIGVAGEFNGKRAYIALDAAEHWKKAHLLCATVRSLSDRTAYTLAETLKSRLTTASFAPDLKPFRPHVTLARKVAHPIPTMDMTSVVWEFDDFALIDSQPGKEGSVYRVLRRFSLVSPNESH
jgi:RNA 2',3'-cyclic 3'-phosphodiesterase